MTPAGRFRGTICLFAGVETGLLSRAAPRRARGDTSVL